MTTVFLSICSFALGFLVYWVARFRQGGAPLVVSIFLILMAYYRSALAPELWRNSFLVFLLLFFGGLLQPATRALPHPWASLRRSGLSAISLLVLWLLAFETGAGQLVALPEYQGTYMGEEVYRVSLLLPVAMSCFVSAIIIELLRIGGIEYGAKRLRSRLSTGGALAALGAAAEAFYSLVPVGPSSSVRVGAPLANDMTLSVAASATVILYSSVAAIALVMTSMAAASVWAKRAPDQAGTQTGTSR